MTRTATNNPYLTGNYAPVDEERTEADLAVEGTIPAGLDGILLRNGPNPYGEVPPNHHWFLGDGMLHGIRIRDGRAEWYRNRWIRTESLAARSHFEAAPGAPGKLTLPGQASVNVVAHGGRILALGEVGLPWEVTAELETVAEHSFDDRLLHSNVTAHPKIDPVTGEMVLFGYDFVDRVHYHVADATGAVVHSTDIAVRPSMMHDIGVTATRTLLMDLPVLFDLGANEAGRMLPYAWDGEAGARLGVLPRYGADADVVWIDLDPCYVFHVVNAYDDGATVVADVIRYPKMFDTSLVGPDEPELGSLVRWVVDPDARTVTTTVLDDRPSEFPRVDPRVETLQHRYSYAVGMRGSVGFDTNDVLRRDHVTGRTQRCSFGEGRFPSEAVFVPAAPDSAEEDGWLLSVVYDAATDRSSVAVLAAADIEQGPVASIPLPVRVPFGFHGNWVPLDA